MVFGFISCHSTNKIPIPKGRYRFGSYSQFLVDSNLRLDPTFCGMDSLLEIPFGPGENVDSSKKRTSFVFLRRFEFTPTPTHEDLFAPCMPFWFVNQRIDARIGLVSSASVRVANGIHIQIYKHKFRIIPYHDDGGVLEKGHIQYTAEYQTLVLNKAHYNISDSIYGSVTYSIVERFPHGPEILYTGAGKFRGKIRILP